MSYNWQLLDSRKEFYKYATQSRNLRRIVAILGGIPGHLCNLGSMAHWATSVAAIPVVLVTT